jgi:hypothetical protein
MGSSRAEGRSSARRSGVASWVIGLANNLLEPMRLPSTIALGVSACATIAACLSTPTPSSAVSGSPLPTLAGWPLGSNSVCVGEEIGPAPLKLEGSVAEGVYVALANGVHIPTFWPPGYTVLYAPTLEILDPSGRVVARAGLDLAIDRPTGLDPCFGADSVGMIPA